jgi:hypothetical protein
MNCREHSQQMAQWLRGYSINSLARSRAASGTVVIALTLDWRKILLLCL